MKKVVFLILFIFGVSYAFADIPPLGNELNPTGGVRITDVTVTQVSSLIVLDSQSDATSTLTTTLYDQYGEEVYTSVTTAGTGIIDVIDTSDLESGFYTITLEDESGAFNQENIVL